MDHTHGSYQKYAFVMLQVAQRNLVFSFQSQSPMHVGATSSCKSDHIWKKISIKVSELHRYHVYVSVRNNVCLT